mmetsp:Transcript_26339/g.67969  ORF Transcript_26339/g.67969 Transcript_26339/m.67969 type:complete len:486 (+) Transcript_26339:209-1666(+)
MGLFSRLFREPKSSDSPHKHQREISPLHAASYIGDLQGVIEVLGSGADVNEGIEMSNRLNGNVQNVTALFLAAQKNHTQIIKVLLQHGADPGILVSCGSNKERCTPAQIAALNGHPLTALYLRKSARQHKKRCCSSCSPGSSEPAHSSVFGHGAPSSIGASLSIDERRSQRLSPALSSEHAVFQPTLPKEQSVLANPQAASQPTSPKEQSVLADPHAASQRTSPTGGCLLDCVLKHGSHEVGPQECQHEEGHHLAALYEPGGQQTHPVASPCAQAEVQEGERKQLEQQQEHDQNGLQHDRNGQQQQQQQQHDQNGQVQQLPAPPQQRQLSLTQQQRLQRHRQRVQQERKQQELKQEQERRKQERQQQQQQYLEEQERKRLQRKRREEQLRKQEQERQPITLQPAVSRMSSLSSNESLFGSKGGPAPSQQPQLDHEGNSDSVPVPLDGAVPEGLNPNGVNKGAAQAEAGAHVYLPLPPTAGIKAAL